MGMKQGLNPNRDHEQGVGNGKVRSGNVKVEVKGKGWRDVHRVSLLQFVALHSGLYLSHIVESVYRGLMEMLERKVVVLNPAGTSDGFWNITYVLDMYSLMKSNPILSYPVCLSCLSSCTVGGVLLTIY
jgi:hypothetical protein